MTQKTLFPEDNIEQDQNLCFVIMPFVPALDNVYTTIEKIIETYCQLKCVRVDEIHSPGRITMDIWMNINRARFLIADLTGRNSNVFYELGIAHARNKSVILLAQNPNEEVPFDLREVRYIHYDPRNLKELYRVLPEYVKTIVSTVPLKWNKDYLPLNWNGAYVKITSLDAPPSVHFGQPFEMTLTARNNGRNAYQGYFSITFPDGIETLEIVESNTETQTGKKGASWAGGRITLSYPIAEGYKYSEKEYSWQNGREYFIKIRGYPNRKGLLRFYVNANCYDGQLNSWKRDPDTKLFDIDQRSEDVYCGVIEVL